MKKYFAIAALLGVFAFASVSFLAQAQQPEGLAIIAQNTAIDAADPSDGEAAADIADGADDAEEAPEPQSKEDMMEAAHDYCTTSSEEVKGAGEEPTEQEIAAEYKKCMKKNKYSDAQIKAYEDGETPK